ncbi:MAG: CAAX protease, partial [Candidatus Eremiobacteraeota bacterium]|nr:CAAX protease [Candidatus Eremiobacteraeota bacterium]
ALPYLGPGVLALLRVWHLLALIVAMSTIARVGFVDAAAFVGLGWVVMLVAQQTFGKPIAELGSKMLDAVAGVRLVSDEDVLVGRAIAGASDAKAQSAALTVAPNAPAHPGAWKAAFGLGAVALLAVLVALTLDPVRGAVFSFENHLPPAFRVPIDLVWLGFLAVIVAGFLAPLETLGWWAGWYGDTIDATVDSTASDDENAVQDATRYVVYLDGVAQSSSRYTPDIETFLDALAPELPAGVRLIRGVVVYSVMNRPLEDDPIFSAMWTFIDKLRFGGSGGLADSLLGMLVNIRNALIVAVSADPRYGPMYNFGIAQVIVKSLVANGYRPKSGTPVTFVGYSGGGQMACGSAQYVKRAIDAPIDVISLGGVISGNDAILVLEHLYHLVGDKDNVERIGPVMFASRWKIAVWSNWNRARRLGRLTQVSLGPVSHQVPGGMLDPDARLPDGRTHLRQTLDDIESILTGRFDVVDPGLKTTVSDYHRFAAVPWNRSEYYPLARTPPGEFHPVADWVGRLLLPSRESRFGGALFEVQHAPDAYAKLAGTTVELVWNEAAAGVLEMLRAVRRDVSFSAQAHYTSTYGGFVHPVRVDRWRLVDPLESLAASHPIDDVTVKLSGDVAVRDGAAATVLAIDRTPIQLTGRYYAIVRFLAAADGDAFRVAHYDSDTRDFTGAEGLVRLPPADDRVIPPLGEGGWYVYGAPDASGEFVVQSMTPYEALEPESDEGWEIGERALAVRIDGGTFGHYAYGSVDIVDDPISRRARFDVTYYHLYAHNSAGLISGPADWSRTMGDRQFGWPGDRPVTEEFVRDRGFDAVERPLAMHLEAMAARYRIGDGTGGTYAGIVHNSTQDSNRALVAVVRPLRAKLQPFGLRLWSDNGFSLGQTFQDAPAQNVVAALTGWRCLFPRVARNTVVRTFTRDGAVVTSRRFGR